MAYPKGVEIPRRKGKMNSTTELKSVAITLDENQLCTLITCFNEGWISVGHSGREDVKEVRKILRDALNEVM